MALKSRICEEFTNLVPESKSQISEDHELWNHKMWGPPVYHAGPHKPLTFTA